jgi:hypothetical protein
VAYGPEPLKESKAVEVKLQETGLEILEWIDEEPTTQARACAIGSQILEAYEGMMVNIKSDSRDAEVVRRR